jgi:plastocyanin
MRRPIRLALVALLALAGVAVDATAAPGALPGLGVLPALAASHDVKILDGSYEPAQLTVFTGEPVSWTNGGSMTHTVTSDSGSELDSGDLAPGEGFGHVFEQPGTYRYHDAHVGASMSGVVTVKQAPASSGATGPTPPPGTLPPNFSPNIPTLQPIPTEAASPSPTPAATAAPLPGDAGPGASLALGAVILAAAALALAAWLLRRRRG